MALSGIYKITSSSNKVYIGQSVDIAKRFGRYKSSSAKNQPKLYNSFMKHGIFNHCFTVIHELPSDVSQEVMNNYEGIYMDFYRDCGVELLNTKEAGSNGRHSQETINKLKSATVATQYKKGQIPWMQGKRHSEETKLILLSASIKGGKVKGIKHTDKAKLKMSKAKKGMPSPNRTKVICTLSGITYLSIKDAATSISIHPHTLQGYLSGFRKNKTTLKYLLSGR